MLLLICCRKRLCSVVILTAFPESPAGPSLPCQSKETTYDSNWTHISKAFDFSLGIGQILGHVMSLNNKWLRFMLIQVRSHKCHSITVSVYVCLKTNNTISAERCEIRTSFWPFFPPRKRPIKTQLKWNSSKAICWMATSDIQTVCMKCFNTQVVVATLCPKSPSGQWGKMNLSKRLSGMVTWWKPQVGLDRE